MAIAETSAQRQGQPGMRTVAGAINGALHAIFEGDDRVHLIGEDLLDPYGGAFKISRGLSTRWPARVHATPISEAAIVGICGGMAMRGLRPVAEIMFGDFIALAFDQILNHVTKFAAMYNGQASAPVTIRTPMGGGRGYGPTHSQSLEKYLVGVPGLDVVAVSHLHDIERMYRTAICESDVPTVIVENKLLYGQELAEVVEGRMNGFAVERSSRPYETITLSLAGFRRADATIVTYGGMTRLALEVARRMLIEHEITADVVVLGCLSPLPFDEMVPAARRSRRVVVLEEGTGRLGIGAEIASVLSERLFGTLAAPVLRVAAEDTIVPAARHLEERMLPNAERLERALLSIVDR
ncbi:MAG: alpha-ketoacid dehydrogenase subunit beta [Bacteroidetes bacterium]|nr:alpha-ketoacid dehydrogenase subunit beta [Bacteroidota bacterium]